MAIDDLTLSREVGVGLRRAPDAPPRAASELLGGGLGAGQSGRDVRERHTENVVQHEREPLGGTQRVEHHEQG